MSVLIPFQEVAPPEVSEIAIFINKEDGQYYYKRHDSEIVKMHDSGNGIYLINDASIIINIINLTGDEISLLSPDNAQFAVKFCCPSPSVQAGGGSVGRPGEQGPQGIQGIPGEEGPAGPPGPESVELGDRNFFVSTDGNDATAQQSDLDLNYLTISAAIADAIIAQAAVADTYNIIIYPGVYLENITVPAFINVYAAVPTNFLYDKAGYAAVFNKYGAANGNVYIDGTITQTGDNVQIGGVNCDGLIINTVNEFSTYSHIVTPSITTNVDFEGTMYDVHAESFLTGDNIDGTLEYCSGATFAFGGGSGVAGGIISGQMRHCVGGNFSFGSASVANPAGDITGRLESCIGGNVSFASTAGGQAGNITGVMIDCLGLAICYASCDTALGIAGTIEGEMWNCKGNDFCYSSSVEGQAGSITGKLYSCQGLSVCFSSSDSGAGGTIPGILKSCNATGNSFSSTNSGLLAGSISGELYNCTGTADANFASTSDGTAGIISGRLFSCRSESYSFSSSNGGLANNITGYLYDCQGNTFCFSSSQALAGGDITGELHNCTATGDFSFASSELGQGGNIVGVTAKLWNCIGDDVCFASSDTAEAGDISGQMIGCIARGEVSFSSSRDSVAGDIAGILISCLALNVISFSSSDLDIGGNISGRLEQCSADDKCFGYGGATGGTIAVQARLIDCSGADDSFCTSPANGGTIDGRLTNCEGQTVCFAGSQVGTGGSISSTAYFKNCACIDYGYANGGGAVGSLQGVLDNCEVGVGVALSLAVLIGNGGLLRNCRITSNVGGTSPVVADTDSIIEYCCILGNANFAVTAAGGGAVTMDLRHSSFFGSGIDPLITNATATPYNTDDVNSIYV